MFSSDLKFVVISPNFVRPLNTGISTEFCIQFFFLSSPGEVTDQVVTDASEDLSHDSSPMHENILSNENETGTKLSLWLQLMLPKVDATVYHVCPRLQRGTCMCVYACLLDYR